MNFHRNRILGLLLGSLLVPLACSNSGGGTDSSTHWLDACSDDSECGALSCLCGVCTAPCAASDVCADLSPTARCEALSHSACGPGAVPLACIARCGSDADCPPNGLSCVDGQCLPRGHRDASAPDASTGGSTGSGSGGTTGTGGSATGGSVTGDAGTDATSDASSSGGSTGSTGGAGSGGSADSGATPDAGEPDGGDGSAPMSDAVAQSDASGTSTDARPTDGGGPACHAGFAVAWGDDSIQNARDMTMDSQGNTLVTGYFAGTLTGLGDPPYLVSDPPAGYDDGYVTKLDAQGNAIWRLRFGGSDGTEQYPLAVAVDPNDDVIVGGSFMTDIVIGTTTLTAPGGFYGKDAFVAKLSGADGAVLAIHQIGGAGEQWLAELAVDPSPPHAVVAIGDFDTEIDCSDGVTPATCPAVDGRDVFIAKIWDATTRRVWTYGGPDDQWGTGVDIDGAGSAAVTGFFRGSFSFGGTTPTLTAVVGTTPDLHEAYVGRIDLPSAASGTAVPVFGMAFSSGGCGDSQYRTGNAVLFDRTLGTSGDVWAAGDYFGCIDLMGTRYDSPSATDGYLVRLDGTTGQLKSARVVAGTSQQRAVNLALDPAGFVMLAGSVRGTVSFDELGASPPRGQEDLFVLRVNPNGVYDSLARWGGTGLAYASTPHIAARTVSGATALGVAATFVGNADFGDGKTVTSGGMADPCAAQFRCDGW